MATFQPWMDAPTLQNEASSHSFVEPLSMALNVSNTDDSDEWEYEYSSTETETFYLTLDLTTPSIPTSRPRAPDSRNGRISTKTKWINPGLGRQKRQLGRAPTISVADKDGEEPNTHDSSGEYAADPADEAPAQDEDNLESEEQVEQNIQILELESDNPLISYRDHTFTCQWTKNIGSELLFAAHEDIHNPLPTLRHLPGGVDLLGSCSARITSSTATIVPVTHTKPLDLTLDDDGPLVESVSAAASDDRRNQARFLERLMKIKETKGEDDEVTVVAYKRMRFHGWIELIRKKLEEERTLLREKLASSTTQEVEEAQKRIAELDEQERNIPREAPPPEDDDEEEVFVEPPVKRQRKRKEMLTEYGEEGAVKQKPRAFRRRPRGDWKRYNIDGSAAGRNTAAKWQHGVHTQDAGSGTWSGGNGNELVEEDAEGEADDSPLPSVYGAVEQQGGYVEGNGDIVMSEAAQGPEMAPVPAPENVTEQEHLIPPGGFTGLLEGDEIRRSPEPE